MGKSRFFLVLARKMCYAKCVFLFGGAALMKIGFDNELYMQKQREHILERISQFNGKLYLEFGGKLFDDYHAARVLPGF